MSFDKGAVREKMTYLVLTVKCDGCEKIIDGIKDTFRNMGEEIGDICNECYEEGNY